jgi:branched-chain amino acid transport system substrate-binding protein
VKETSGWRRRSRGLVALLAGLFILSACGTSSAPSSSASGNGSSVGGNGLPATVHIKSIKEMTGAAAFAGTSAEKGVELAVQQINQEHFLGNTKLKVDLKDSGASPQKAASFATQAVADKSYSVISGPLLGQSAVAVAPIVQKAKMPTVFTQAGSKGVVIGDYTYRVTAPQATYYADNVGPYMQSKHVKSVSIVYDSDNPTLTQLGTKVLPKMAKKYGFTIKSTTAVQIATQDFTAPASKISKEKPDAAVLLMIGAQYPPAVTQLRQRGFSGLLFANQGAGGGNLKPAGKAAVGTTWATDFNVDNPTPETNKFVSLYEKKYHKDPLDYAAEAYDSIWLIARGLKQANSADRTKLNKGLQSVVQHGFKGAEGTLRFVHNDLRISGLLVRWNGKKEVLVSKAG